MTKTSESAAQLAERAVADLFKNQALVSIDDAAAAGGAAISTVKGDPDFPAPVIQAHRFSRWLAADVRAYWRRRIEIGMLAASANGAKLSARGKKASAAAVARRHPAAVTQSSSAP